MEILVTSNVCERINWIQPQVSRVENYEHFCSWIHDFMILWFYELMIFEEKKYYFAALERSAKLAVGALFLNQPTNI